MLGRAEVRHEVRPGRRYLRLGQQILDGLGHEADSKRVPWLGSQSDPAIEPGGRVDVQHPDRNLAVVSESVLDPGRHQDKGAGRRRGLAALQDEGHLAFENEERVVLVFMRVRLEFAACLDRDDREVEPRRVRGSSKELDVAEHVALAGRNDDRFGHDADTKWDNPLVARGGSVAGMRGEMVGRADELASAIRALEGAADEQGAKVIAVRGEPGIGKSRLLEALQAEAAERDILALGARAAQFERDVPFAVVVEALDAYLDSQNPRRFERMGDTRLSELARVFPALEDLSPDITPGLVAERYRVHRAVASLIELLAGHKPLLLALDDVQWADEASLEMVAHLCRRPPRARLLLWLGYRPGEAPDGLVAALDEAERSDVLETVDLSPLSADEANELLGLEADSPASVRLHHEAGGNPLFLEQLSRESDESLRAPLELGAPGAPESVRNSLGRELDALDPSSRSLIEAAAVAGDPFELDVAMSAVEMDEAPALRALDELIARELLYATAEPRRFRFRHPIVRRAVYASARPGWRLGAHRRSARPPRRSRRARDRGGPPRRAIRGDGRCRGDRVATQGGRRSIGDGAGRGRALVQGRAGTDAGR